MIKIFLLTLFCLFSSAVTAQDLHQDTLHDGTLISCETRDGMLHGEYKSYYADGRERSLGRFIANQRIGEWKVWGREKGEVVMRNYRKPLVYEEVLPKPPKNNLVQLMKTRGDYSEINSEGVRAYANVPETAIYWAKKRYRMLDRRNAVLFENGGLAEILNELILNDKVKIYGDYRFGYTLDERRPVNNGAELIGFLISEIGFFDFNRKLYENRVIGLSTVYHDPGTGKTTVRDRFHYPALRKFLAKEFLIATGYPAYVRTLDDIFYYGAYSGTLYKNPKNWSGKHPLLSDDVDTYTAEGEYDIGVIEATHRTWLELYDFVKTGTKKYETPPELSHD